MQLRRQYVRPQQRHLVRQWHTGVQGRGGLDPEGSALSQQRGDGVLLGLRHAAAEIPRPAVLVVGRARALALLAAAARSLRRVRGGEQLRQRGTRRRRHRHRILRHSSRLGPGLSSRCVTRQRSLRCLLGFSAVNFERKFAEKSRAAVNLCGTDGEKFGNHWTRFKAPGYVMTLHLQENTVRCKIRFNYTPY